MGSVIVVLTFLLAYYGRSVFGALAGIDVENQYLALLYYYAWWVIPSSIVALIYYKPQNFFSRIGLSNDFYKALKFSFLCTLPMILSSAIMGKILYDGNFIQHAFGLLRTTLFAGFFEEYFFRAFLFGMLFYKMKWGFVPAALLGAIIFGMGHMYQGESVVQTVIIFGITAMGAAWFAWLLVEWGNNLWVPIFMHIFMNISWVLFDISENAMGGLLSNVFRTTTIALTIIYTIRKNKQSGMRVNTQNLFYNKNKG